MRIIITCRYVWLLFFAFLSFSSLPKSSSLSKRFTEVLLWDPVELEWMLYTESPLGVSVVHTLPPALLYCQRLNEADCVQMSFMRSDQNNFSWHFIWLLVLSVSDKVLLSVLTSNVSFDNLHRVFDSAGHHSSVQEDAQIHLWKTLTGVQTGVLGQTGECVEHRNWWLCELWCFWSSRRHLCVTRLSAPHVLISFCCKLVRFCVFYMESNPNTSSNPVFLSGRCVPVKAAGMMLW